MDGQIDEGWKDGWMDKLMGGWIGDGWMVECVDKLDGQIKLRVVDEIDGHVVELLDRRMSGQVNLGVVGMVGR